MHPAQVRPGFAQGRVGVVRAVKQTGPNPRGRTRSRFAAPCWINPGFAFWGSHHDRPVLRRKPSGFAGPFRSSELSGPTGAVASLPRKLPPVHGVQGLHLRPHGRS